MALDLDELRTERLRLSLGLLDAVIPQLREHAARHLEQRIAGLSGEQQPFELALNLVAADRLSIGGAAALRTEIVGVAGIRALGPGGGQRRLAIVAEHEAAQREVLAHILTAGKVVQPVKAIIDTLEGLEADKRLVLTRAERYAPARRFDVSRIGALGEEDADSLMTDDAGAVLWEQRIVLEEAHHIGLRLEASRRIAFQRLLHDGCDRLVPDEHLTAPADAGVAIAHRSLEHPIAILNTRPHPVLRLLAVLLALVLRDGRKEVLDKD